MGTWTSKQHNSAHVLIFAYFPSELRGIAIIVAFAPDLWGTL